MWLMMDWIYLHAILAGTNTSSSILRIFWPKANIHSWCQIYVGLFCVTTNPELIAIGNILLMSMAIWALLLIGLQNLQQEGCTKRNNYTTKVLNLEKMVHCVSFKKSFNLCFWAKL